MRSLQFPQIAVAVVTSLLATLCSAQDPEYWRAPFVLRITSDNASFPGPAFLANPPKRSGLEVVPHANPRDAFTVYPSRPLFPPNANPPPGFVGNLYQDEYHSKTNSSEFVLMCTNRPNIVGVSGTHLFDLITLKDPYGQSPSWHGYYVVEWGNWIFAWDAGRGRYYLTSQNDERWRWLAYEYMAGAWSMKLWDGIIPPTDQGWPWPYFEVPRDGIQVDVEVVPLWTLLNTTDVQVA